MNLLRVAILAALFALNQTSPVLADDITLKSSDGAVEISGMLLGFDGEFYRIQTKFGELTVDSSGVLCDGPACPSLTDYVAEVSISGSATMGEVLLPALIEAFALRNGYDVQRITGSQTRFDYLLAEGGSGRDLAVFTFNMSNTDQGFSDLLEGQADVVMAMREIRNAEAKEAYLAGLGDMEHHNRSRVIALDAMVPVVSPGNPVKSISPAELARVFAGKITNWQDLGGSDAPIALHLPTQKSGLAQAMEDQLMGPANMALTKDVRRHGNSLTLIHSVLSDPFAISIAAFSETGNSQVLALAGSCGFSLRAARRTVKTEDYPLTAPMFLYLPARRLPKVARDFLTYTRSPSAQIVIRRAGFVDQAPEEVSVNAQGDRFANAISISGDEVPLEELKRMVTRLAPMKRLTTTFRFETGSVRLDAQSRSNVQQLARALEAGIYDARKLVFVGFSDGNGAAEGNRGIGQRRAVTVRDAVLRAAETANTDRLLIETESFGEALPMACDDSAWGRQANRRVEVWVE